MAFTQAQLDAIEDAIAGSELTVTFSDGKSVTYRSIADLIAARNTIKDSMSTTASTLSTLASFTKE